MFKHKLKIILTGVVLVISFLSIPSGLREAGNTLSQILSYVGRTISYVTADLRWLSIFSGLLLVLFFIRLYRLRDIPLRIVESEFYLELKKDWSRTKMARTQWVIANRPKVEALRTNMTPDHGTIEKDGMVLRMLYKNEDFSKTPKLFGNPKKGWKIFHITKKEFPYFFGTELIPASLLAFLKNSPIGKHLLVRREFESWHIDEYCVEEPTLELTSVNYSSHNIKMQLKFVNCTPPNEVKVFIIRLNGVDEEIFDKIAGSGTIFEYTQKSLLRGEGLLVTWKNPNFHQAQQASTATS